MKYIVTGAAGFVGSHLCERLLADGHEVVGIDCFIDTYPRWFKERNLAGVRTNPRFKLVEGSLLEADLRSLINEGDVIFHEAAMAGVRSSWGDDFAAYTRNNIVGSQVLLEACRDKGVARFVYASSSSIYGDAESMPTREDVHPSPLSPYGVSKLAAEHLCRVYWKNFQVPTVSLRYFTVYGPRQRPDMAFHRLLRAGLTGSEFPLYGNGSQTRDFTFIEDVVEANMAASRTQGGGLVLNIGGGSRISMNDTIGLAEKILSRPIRLKRHEKQSGDVRHTSADISAAREILGYKPRVGIEEGLRKEAQWLEALLPEMAARTSSANANARSESK